MEERPKGRSLRGCEPVDRIHEVELNSRRTGVEPGNPHLLPPKGARLFQVDAEENLVEVVKTQDIAKAVIK